MPRLGSISRTEHRFQQHGHAFAYRQSRLRYDAPGMLCPEKRARTAPNQAERDFTSFRGRTCDLAHNNSLVRTVERRVHARPLLSNRSRIKRQLNIRAREAFSYEAIDLPPRSFHSFHEVDVIFRTRVFGTLVIVGDFEELRASHLSTLSRL